MDSMDNTAWVDDSWLDTVVVIGITCFILCLMGLSKVPSARMGMICKWRMKCDGLPLDVDLN